MVFKAIKWFILFLVIAVLGVLAYLLIAPPDILRVGTNYAAKMVCSNVFIAGRAPEDILATDVQAPGNPLFSFVTARVDEDAQSVETRLLNLIAPASSQYREGLGCTNLHDNGLSETVLPSRSRLSDALWPEGNHVSPSQNAALNGILTDATLVGPAMRAVVIVHNGRIIGETYGEGFDETTPLLGWSMTKTVSAALIGALIEDGRLTRGDTLTQAYPEWRHDERANITYENMLGMVSGLRWNESYGNLSDVTRMLYLTEDMANFAAKSPLVSEVGESFNYSSGTTTAMSRSWQDAVEEDLAYPARAIFGPLGMTSAVMETDVFDTFVGSSYMYATARDWARFGQFLLQKGEWNGLEILPQGYVDWMFEPVITSGGDYTKGSLWRTVPRRKMVFEDAVWLQGHDGQSIGIFPSHDLVVVRLGLSPSREGYSPLQMVQKVIEQLGD
ncbi:MAG: serine hydrolase [Pseudomonadota bacterium]